MPPSQCTPPETPAAAAGTERLVDKLTDFLARVSPAGNILFVSKTGAEWLDRPGAFFVKGSSLLAAVAPDDHEPLREALAATPSQGRQALFARMLRGDGSQVWATCRLLPLSNVGGHVELLFAAWDIAAFPEARELPDSAALIDELTGLANRRRLLQQLAAMTRSPGRRGTGFTLMHLGLDGFKKVNDALGHAVGDQLLVEVAHRLTSLLRDADLVARTGGDEFGLILPGLHDREDALLVASKILSAMQRPYPQGVNHLHLSTSIGIAFYPEHASDGRSLFKQADIALTMAKEAGRNRCYVYVAEGEAVFRQRILLEEYMYDAVQNGEFEMHYQPLFRADSGEMVGMEALMRWNRPGYGPVSPAEFIPLAEENGLIGFLGAWSLRVSCHQVARWNEAWGVRLRASVNLSPVQFRQGDIVASVRGVLAESGLPADCLSLEITEGVLMRDPARTETVLASLRESGVSLSVDDFGTGYSSLAYLKRFPLSCLKIDQSFIYDLTQDNNGQAIVSAILSLARELDLETVAEGVESEQQLAILRSKGCDFIQGYLLGRPVPPDELTRKVETGEWRLKI